MDGVADQLLRTAKRIYDHPKRDEREREIEGERETERGGGERESEKETEGEDRTLVGGPDSINHKHE